MIYVGIDVAKDKHDCYISDSDGVELYAPFIVSNTKEGFEDLFFKIKQVTDDLTKVKVGLEATGHYSYNILGFLDVCSHDGRHGLKGLSSASREHIIHKIIEQVVSKDTR